MKAAVHTRYGPPSVVRILDVDTPVAGPDQVLIMVHATTVNRTDCAYRAGRPTPLRVVYGPVKPKATILGNEFAGEVAAVGGGVSRFAVGDRVFGYNEGRFGAHAEYLVMRQDGPLAAIPADVGYEQAAPSIEGSHYALSLIRAAKVRSGQDVLVNGATGGIGSAAVQLAKGLGATVTGVCGAEHLELVRGLGADRVIDYTSADFTKDGRTYDVVIDAVGKSSFGVCKPVLRDRGMYLSSELGPWSQNPLLALVTPLLRGKKVLFPIPRQSQEMVEYFKGLIEAGTFRPVIDRQYPLDEIVEAYRYVDSGQKIGNVVISVGH
jgi:NADPH:quinone reductase-like Zn-dependent oxidoreductase